MDMSWRRWQFWLFSAISSWALVPVLEELFYRGYCQRRLAEDWGEGPAIFGAACLFTFTTQYLRPNAYSFDMLMGLLISAVGFGVVFAWTRSLVPCIIAHALFDIPMAIVWQSFLLAGLGITAFVTWRQAAHIVKSVLSTANVFACVTLGIIEAGYAIVAWRDIFAIYIAAVLMLALAVVLEVNDKRSHCAATDRQTK